MKLLDRLNIPKRIYTRNIDNGKIPIKGENVFLRYRDMEDMTFRYEERNHILNLRFKLVIEEEYIHTYHITSYYDENMKPGIDIDSTFQVCYIHNKPPVRWKSGLNDLSDTLCAEGLKIFKENLPQYINRGERNYV